MKVILILTTFMAGSPEAIIGTQEQPSLEVCWAKATEIMAQVVPAIAAPIEGVGVTCYVTRAGDPA